jgi:hypothetical protein
MFGRLFGAALHNSRVRFHEVVTAHARLARKSCGDNYHIAVCSVGVIVCASDVCVIKLDGARFEQVERLALGDPLSDVDKHNIAQFLCGSPMGRCGSYVSCTYDGNLVAPWHFAEKFPSRGLGPDIRYNKFGRNCVQDEKTFRRM